MRLSPALPAPACAMALGCALAAGCAGPADEKTDADAKADDSGALDSGAGGPDWDPSASIYENCWPELRPAEAGFPVYENFGLVPGRHCQGSDHQQIEGVEKLVFLGDSITAGTPPTPADEIWRVRFTAAMKARFGEGLEVADCSEFGARTDDYLPDQLPRCFPGPEPKRTLIVSTMGGNDLFSAASAYTEGRGIDAALAVLDRAVGYQREALRSLRETEAERFPAGLFVITANVYEFTDTTGDLSSCPLADQLGFGGQAREVTFATSYMNAQFAEIAVETGTDLVFMGEEFCGHGFHSADPALPCYRGPDAPAYFDLTCIHPSPEGHAKLSEMFAAVVGG